MCHFRAMMCCAWNMCHMLNTAAINILKNSLLFVIRFHLSVFGTVCRYIKLLISCVTGQTI